MKNLLLKYVSNILNREFLPEANSVKPDIILHSELKYPGDLYWTVAISWNGVKYEYEILDHLLNKCKSGLKKHKNKLVYANCVKKNARAERRVE